MPRSPESYASTGKEPQARPCSGPSSRYRVDQKKVLIIGLIPDSRGQIKKVHKGNQRKVLSKYLRILPASRKSENLISFFMLENSQQSMAPPQRAPAPLRKYRPPHCLGSPRGNSRSTKESPNFPGALRAPRRFPLMLNK